jgi:N-acyl-D-amino-acid deacylase
MVGGETAMRKRLRDPEQRGRVIEDILRPKYQWPNFYANAGSPDNIKLISFKQASLKPLQGKSLSEIAKLRGEIARVELLVKKLQTELQLERDYNQALEQQIRNLIASN